MTPMPTTPGGEAALILCESLLHVLLEKGVLNTEDIMSVVGSAVAVARDAAPEEAAETESPCLSLLLDIAASFETA